MKMPALPDPYADRDYRALHHAKDLLYYRVSVKETDLHIGTRRVLEAEALEAILAARQAVEAAIADRPRFRSSLEPLQSHGTEPPIIRRMLEAGASASVGPMAAVAGAIAEFVGRRLSGRSREVIVENGGDVFLRGDRERLVAVHAGTSPLSGLLAVAVQPGDGLGVCTSSATVGHSLSLGRADAALVIAGSCALADAAATRLGNLCTGAEAIQPALEEICAIPGIEGALVVMEEQIGMLGNIVIRAKIGRAHV